MPRRAGTPTIITTVRMKLPLYNRARASGHTYTALIETGLDVLCPLEGSLAGDDVPVAPTESLDGPTAAELVRLVAEDDR